MKTVINDELRLFLRKTSVYIAEILLWYFRASGASVLHLCNKNSLINSDVCRYMFDWYYHLIKEQLSSYTVIWKNQKTEHILLKFVEVRLTKLLQQQDEDENLSRFVFVTN